MPCIIGYLRLDMNGQDVRSQLDQLKAAGASKIIQEQAVGIKRDSPELARLMAEVRVDDTVVVTSLDSIARNIRHLLEIIESLDAAGVAFKVLDNGIDTTTSQGKDLRMLLKAITDFERKMARERQAAGIDAAKRQGRYKGRKPTAMAKAEEVQTLNAQGLTRQKIADQLGIGVASVYRILKTQSVTQKKQKQPPKKAVIKKEQVERKPKATPDTGQLSLF